MVALAVILNLGGERRIPMNLETSQDHIKQDHLKRAGQREKEEEDKEGREGEGGEREELRWGGVQQKPGVRGETALSACSTIPRRTPCAEHVWT